MWTYLLLLFFTAFHAVDAGVFKNAKLSIDIEQQTSPWCNGAGTSCDVSISLGFVDASNALVYALHTAAQKGSEHFRFERGDRYRFTHNVPDGDFQKVEEECTKLAIKPSGAFDEAAYQGCFDVNLIYFRLYTWWGNFGSDWKPSGTYVTLSFTLPDGSVQKRVFHFKAMDHGNANCDIGWVAGGGEHYMCLDQKSSGEYLPSGNGLTKGAYYPCHAG
uniref:Carb-bd_dom_fam9 domain-containing protein n=1 Tax=Steinernema glaseri TaxID=37863 RepID=A0A1I7ZGF3_9BILA